MFYITTLSAADCVALIADDIWQWSDHSFDSVHLSSRDRIVGRGTTLPPGRSRVRISIGTRYFSLLQNVQTGSGTDPASYSISSWVLSRGKAAEAWSSPLAPFTVEVKNEWSYTSTSPYAFMTPLTRSLVGIIGGKELKVSKLTSPSFGTTFTRNFITSLFHSFIHSVVCLTTGP
jgi:hypothetical protein